MDVEPSIFYVLGAIWTKETCSLQNLRVENKCISFISSQFWGCRLESKIALRRLKVTLS
jgi:hypothetical protein